MTINDVAFFAPLNTSRYAGDTVRVFELLHGLRSLGVSVTPIIPSGISKDLGKKISPYSEWNLPLSNNVMLRYLSLALFCQYFPPPIVHDSSFDILQIECAYALPLSKIRKMAKCNNVIFDMHSIAAIDLSSYIPSIFKLPLVSAIHSAQDYLCKTSHVLVVSNCMKQYIILRLRIDPSTIHVIENGINLDFAKKMIRMNASHFQYLHEGANPLLVYVGGLEWYEGVDVLIRALGIVKKEIPEVVLIIAGKGSDESHLKHLVRKMGLQKNVIFLGWVPYEDTFPLQSIADILIAPRKPLHMGHIDITSPIKIPSYLSAEKPIIASKLGEIPYVARHMKEAYLVDHTDVYQLSQAIITIAQDEHLSKRLGRNASIRAERYDWKTICKRLLNVYQYVLS